MTDDHAGRARLHFLRPKQPSGRRLNAQHVEIVRRHNMPPDAFWSAIHGRNHERHGRQKCRGGLKLAAQVAVFLEIRKRHGRLETDQRVRFPHPRRFLEDRGLELGEHRSGQSNADTQAHGHCQSEAG